MVYVLCLESQNLKVTKEQVFAATLLSIMKENFNSINKISIISPVTIKAAKYNYLVKYNSSLEDEFITNFIEEYGLTLSFAILSKEAEKKLDDLVSLKYYLCDILLQAYENPDLPETINTSDINLYIEKIGVNIKDNVLKYYKNISQDVQ